MLAIALYPTVRASAHVYVLPDRSAPGTYEHYVVYVHAERPRVPSVELRLLIPVGVVVDAMAETTWTVTPTIEKGRITMLTWSGGTLAPGHYATYGFAARNPRNGTAITWRALQRYADGTVVTWGGAPESAQPAAVTVLRGAAAGPSGTPATAPVAAAPGFSAVTAVALVAGLLGFVSGLTSLGILIVALRHRLLS